MSNRKKKKGQSTLEYIILVVAVVAVMVGFLVRSNSPFQTAVNTAMTSGTTGMTTMATHITNNLVMN